MKACIVLQRRFAPVGHKIALALRERHGIRDFCGYVYLRSSYEFLTAQKEIAYTSLLLDEDLHERFRHEKLDPEYLRWLEATYGLPNLWPYLALDRVIMYHMGVREYPYDTPPYTHEEMQRILQVKARAIIEFLDREKPDFIYMPAIGAAANMLLYHIGKAKGIRVFVGAETRVDRGYGVSEDYRTFTGAEKRFRELLAGRAVSPRLADAKAFLERFRARPTTYLYIMKYYQNVGNRLRDVRWFFSAKLFRSVGWFLKSSYQYVVDRKWNDYLEPNPFAYLSDRVARKIRTLRGYRDLYDAPDMSEDYAYFPLHLEPEIAILLIAPHWTDQVNLARQIAMALPLNFKLYIKEHPAMLGYRTRAYYQELKKIPNVKLLDPNVNTFELTRNAKITFTLTGTVAWESPFLKIPAITFGDVPVNALSMVKKCTSLEALAPLVKDRLAHHTHHEEELEKFIAATMEDSVESGLHEIWEQDVPPDVARERIGLVADLIMGKVRTPA